MNPIYNPAVPVNLNVTVHPGFMVYVTGVPNGNRFSVNFKCGPAENADIAFHFNPRFDDGNVVVRNTRQHNAWGGEERMSNGFPFQRGQPFELIFLCQSQQYKVAVNGRHYIEYKHRIPLQRVNFVHVTGNVVVQMIKFDREGTQQPLPTSVNNPTIPHAMIVPYNNIKGRTVTLCGIPENRPPRRMMFDFQTDGNPADIFFHFNPRFAERVLVRNARKGNSWGKEERELSMPFPFQYGVPFQIIVSVDQHCFRVDLNGMTICNFNHRQRPLNRIRKVTVGGSVQVTQMYFK